MSNGFKDYIPHLCCLLVPAMLLACSTARAPVAARGDSETARPMVTEGQTPAPISDGAFVTTHEVVRGDTLYSIAWRYGKDYRDLGRWNGIGEPYLIVPGQRLSLVAGKVPPVPVARSPQPAAVPQRSLGTPPRVTPVPPAPTTTVKPTLGSGPIRWRWPTVGTVIKSDSPTARKGLGITGAQGQVVSAAAAGAVVYSGSGLLGYGRLIILKHSDTYLSAYAYNAQLLVAEGDQVTSGQRIATMGRDNDGRPMLHFEIRKDGKPVNPLQHLPSPPPSERS